MSETAHLAGSADGIIVMKMDAGVFTINLKSSGNVEILSRNKKVIEVNPSISFRDISYM
jgi:hypothetical protein